MARETEADIVVDVPVEVAYRAWTDFEHYPRFMTYVKEVRRVGDGGRRLHWVSTVGGRRREWDAEVYDLTTNQRVAWRSLSGAVHDAQVVLEPQGDQTRVTLRWRYDPPADDSGSLSVADDIEQAVREDLVNFKQLIETGQPPQQTSWVMWLAVGAGAAGALLCGIGIGVWYALARQRTGRNADQPLFLPTLRTPSATSRAATLNHKVSARSGTK